ncbi:heme anaerobic degradation radical SAM methyltransferase ChuW/HutW [Mannheimia sp. AT1]|uniref:Heme anaerobic degradation radical SAM methyltransferase ChuW/HutW n=1 Tax=Mannheimia cairinae TaxID=3025936 RepID=A0ABT5MPS2_9PAST|nr:heme anaerobic degradation radical SAM methyltransferase ChuW/HutW [Mannheimia cairinae]MDD0824178.1 heme anaerobic degradation radical SAM methyltransferase ChuW/HutW [Mannheimia cairinae]MDD0826883.1 heme anaerobic degradation radical SAM methyltransferase ChuW/HutW [Mannheimia cairinae]
MNIQNLNWTPQQASPNAFPERQALMPIWGGENINRGEWQSVWQQQATYALKEDGVAYFHIPFCASHCIFCGFYRNAWKEGYSKSYTDRVIAELAYEATLRHSEGKIRAVYFGGGTPTALHTEDLVRLIRACYQYLPLAEDCEFTIEGRISHFDIEKAKACIEAGVNRISIGIQTFNSALRKRLGRKHSGEEALEYLTALTELDAVIVADLIFGLPNQSDEIWQKDIEIAASLPIAGLDIYAFNNYPFLPINRLIEHGTLPAPAGFDTQSLHYAYAVEYLTKSGWQQVSNNHFAFPNRGERNRYNTLVKSNMPCLAFGSGAGGNFGGLSYQVQSDLNRYLNSPPDQKNLSYLSKHGEHKPLLGTIQHSIELGYLDTTPFIDNSKATKLLHQWQTLNLLKLEGKMATLNTSGRYWSPTLIRKLMLTLPESKKEQIMTTQLNTELTDKLRENLKANPGQILEMLAGMNQCSLESVINCLPSEMVMKTDGDRFVEIMQAIASWNEPVTFILHTPDAIAEVTGKLPQGKIARGFYNFDHNEEGGIHGHLRYENCASIYLLDRPFMGKRTVALTFINRSGEAMFKVFVGRDEKGQLRENQISAMQQLMKGESE